MRMGNFFKHRCSIGESLCPSGHGPSPSKGGTCLTGQKKKKVVIPTTNLFLLNLKKSNTMKNTMQNYTFFQTYKTFGWKTFTYMRIS